MRALPSCAPAPQPCASAPSTPCVRPSRPPPTPRRRAPGHRGPQRRWQVHTAQPHLWGDRAHQRHVSDCCCVFACLAPPCPQCQTAARDHCRACYCEVGGCPCFPLAPVPHLTPDMCAAGARSGTPQWWATSRRCGCTHTPQAHTARLRPSDGGAHRLIGTSCCRVTMHPHL
jgi:hypothetical protein